MLTGMLSHSPPLGSFEIHLAETLNKAYKLLEKKKFDVALLDLNLDDSSGLQSLKKLNEKCPLLPIVINTGSYPDDLGLKAITSGAQDYLIKGKYKSYGLSKSLYYAVERKRSEQEIQTAYNKFKETQSQLIQAEKINTIGSIASGVAHEVKNPLATILYGVEFLSTKLGNTDDEKIQLTLKSIKEATNKANTIIRDLLDFSSLSILKKKPEDINEILLQATKLIVHQCEKKGIEIKTELDKNLREIKIDKNRIEQVIVDLFVNAIYAMEDGGELTIKTYAEKLSHKDYEVISKSLKGFKDKEMVTIVEIDDTGPGFSEEGLSKSFDPFFTTRRASGGVGLGLAIAKTIMQNHNAYISLKNREQGGAQARLIFKS